MLPGNVNGKGVLFESLVAHLPLMSAWSPQSVEHQL